MNERRWYSFVALVWLSGASCAAKGINNCGTTVVIPMSKLAIANHGRFLAVPISARKIATIT